MVDLPDLTVAIFARPNIANDLARQTISLLIELLEKEGYTVRLDRYAAGYVGTRGLPDNEVCNNAKFAVVLGGDGTLLTASHQIPTGMPVLAVNLGNLGFLTTTTVEHMPAMVERVIAGDYDIMDRAFVQVQVMDGGAPVFPIYAAMNDIVFKPISGDCMLSFTATIDHQPVAQYKADGLIISTPTGSTAYSLAAGGPIVHPKLNAVLITPIAPHTLTFRPLVVAADMEVCITVNEHANMTYDGRVGGLIKPSMECIITASEKRLRLIQPRHAPYFTVLQSKLHWGQ